MQPSQTAPVSGLDNTPYDFNNPQVKGAFDAGAGNPNAFQWDRIMQLNDAYKSQFGTNITPAALFRNYNEAAGNYLWGPPAGTDYGQFVAANPGANVSNPQASIVTPNGTYQGGSFTPTATAAVAGVQPFTDPVFNAPGLAQIDPWQTINRTLPNGTATQTGGLAGAMANLTNTQNGLGVNGSQAPGAGAQTGGAGGLTTDSLLQQIQQAIANQKNPFDLLQGRENALGIPGQQQQVSGLRQAITNTTNLLNQIAPGVQGRTANSLVTAAQANRMIQNESAPVQQQLQNLGVQASDAQSVLNNLMNQATGEANMQEQGQQDVLKNLTSLQGLVSQQQQFAEQIRQFNVGQARDKYEFEKNLQLETDKFNLSKAAQDEARREFDANQQFELGKIQEQARQFMAQLQQTQQTQALRDQLTMAQASLDNARAQNLGSAPSSGGGGGKGGGGGGSTPSISTVINFVKNAPASQLRQMYNITDPVFGEYNPNSHNYYRWEIAKQELNAAGFNGDDPAIADQLRKIFGGP